MKNRKIDKFLEEHNMTYMFLLLAELEAERLNNLPYTIRKKIEGKVTTKALEHIASNDIPDYVIRDIKEESEKKKASKKE